MHEASIISCDSWALMRTNIRRIVGCQRYKSVLRQKLLLDSLRGTSSVHATQRHYSTVGRLPRYCLLDTKLDAVSGITLLAVFNLDFGVYCQPRFVMFFLWIQIAVIIHIHTYVHTFIHTFVHTFIHSSYMHTHSLGVVCACVRARLCICKCIFI